MGGCSTRLPLVSLFLLLPTLISLYSLLVIHEVSAANTYYHDFHVVSTNKTLLCETKETVTINGQYPGPTLYVNKGDIAMVNVYNEGPYKVTLHWHGLKEPRNPWSDGPEYITQCGIPPGQNMTYTLNFTSEETTIWYHAHTDWTRATVHGAIVVYPEEGTTYPFPQPDEEAVIVIGEWYKENVMDVMNQGMYEGGDFNNSDAYTFNGMAGDLYECADSYKIKVEQNKTYLFRLVNAAITNGHFLSIANHTITVVARDGAYLKPFKTNYIWITSGQTMDILVEANQALGYYYMAASPFSNAPTGQFNNSTGTAILEYVGASNDSSSMLYVPDLPIFTDSTSIFYFDMQLHSINTKEHPIDLPMEIDHHLAFDFSINLMPCANHSCKANYGDRFASSVNNVSFDNPDYDILQAYYYNLKDVYSEDFPDFPPLIYNFTEQVTSGDLLWTSKGTKVKVLKYNETVELVLQGAALLAPENHPIHLHGYSFYQVGMGFGNFDPVKDPASFNLVDPPYVNTVGTPTSGWTVVRFRATNPGVWLMHCHLSRHLSWGMVAVIIVLDGPTNETSLLPRPEGMPNFCPGKLYSSS